MSGPRTRLAALRPDPSDRERLRTAIGHNRLTAVVGLLHGATEDQRREHLALLDEMLTAPDHPWTWQHAFRVALYGCADLPRIRREPQLLQPEGDMVDAVFLVLRDRRPPWLDEWATWALDRFAGTWTDERVWRLVHRLARDGACAHPATDVSTRGLVEFLPRHMDTAELVRYLADDPALLRREIPRLFTLEGVARLLRDPAPAHGSPAHGSPAHGSPAQGGASWVDALAQLAADGHLERDALLDGCLHAFLQDLPDQTLPAGGPTWCAALWARLQPTDEEVMARLPLLRRLLAGPAVGVRLALTACARPEATARLGTDDWLELLGEAAVHLDRAVVLDSLRFLDRLGRDRPELRGRVALAAAPALLHERVTVVRRAVTLLRRHGRNLDEDLHEDLAGLLVDTPAAVRAELTEQLGLSAAPAPGAVVSGNPQASGELEDLAARVERLPEEIRHRFALPALLAAARAGTLPGPLPAVPCAGVNPDPQPAAAAAPAGHSDPASAAVGAEHSGPASAATADPEPVGTPGRPTGGCHPASLVPVRGAAELVELLDRLMDGVEDRAGALELERALEGVARLGDAPDSVRRTGERLVGRAHRQLRQLWNPADLVTAASPEQLVAALVLAWVRRETPWYEGSGADGGRVRLLQDGGAPLTEAPGHADLLALRVAEVGVHAAAGRQATLLALPTSGDGTVAPAELVRRAGQAGADGTVLLADAAQALLRLGVGADTRNLEQARARAATLPGDLGAALRRALGGPGGAPLPPTFGLCAEWVARWAATGGPPFVDELPEEVFQTRSWTGYYNHRPYVDDTVRAPLGQLLTSPLTELLLPSALASPSAWHVTLGASGGHMVLPTAPELVWAHAVSVLHGATFAAFVPRPGVTLLRQLSDPCSPLPTTALRAIMLGLSAARTEVRAATVDVLAAAASDGRLDGRALPAATAREICRRGVTVTGDPLTVRRVAGSLAQAARAGSAAELHIADTLEVLLSGPGSPLRPEANVNPLLDLLLELRTGQGAAVTDPATRAALAQLAAAGGRSRRVTLARRLLDLTEQPHAVDVRRAAAVEVLRRRVELAEETAVEP